MQTTTMEMDAVMHDGATVAPRVLVLDRSGQFAEQLARAASGIDPAPEVLRLRRPTRVAEAVRRTPVDVIVAGPSEVTGAGLRRLTALRRENPRLVILLTQNGRPVPVAEAVACGATEVLPWPGHPGRMRNGLQRALRTAELLRAERVVVREPEPAPVAPAGVKTGHVFTVTSATGGCGKTFFATNFAGYLARATGKRVVLVDLDLQFGEVSVALRLRPQRTIAELFDDTDPGWTDGESGGARIGDAIITHAAGYDVLCAPKDPIAADRIGPREATELLDAARREYDYVVVDTPPALNEVVLAAFDLSGSLVVMATMDIPSLKNLSVFLQTLDRLKVPAEGVSLVLNKAEEGTGIELSQVLRLHPFGAVLPYDREVSRSINVGMPVVFSSPGSEVSRRIVEGATRLVPPSPDATLPWGASTGSRPRRRLQLPRLFRKGESR